MQLPSAAAIQRVLAVLAFAFGTATVVAGSRVLLGSDPGYAVYLPLLLFNTGMGVAYLGAAVLIWADLRRGMYAAGAILVLNALVLGGIAWMRSAGADIAAQSLGAMSLRTAVWLLLWAALAWLGRRGQRAAVPAA